MSLLPQIKGTFKRSATELRLAVPKQHQAISHG